MNIESGNLFSELPKSLPEELVTILVKQGNLRMERIVSTGHNSPPGFWYDQADHEWVMVLQGEAKVMMEGEEYPHHLLAGDFLWIEAHRRHRVEWTTLSEPTVWLAVFYSV